MRQIETSSAVASRFLYVDGLRELAALAVVLFHAHAGAHLDRLPAVVGEILEHGDLGVPVFFTLSGFVIATVCATTWRRPASSDVSSRVGPCVSLHPTTGAIALVIGMQWLSARVTGQSFETPSAARVGAHLVYGQGLLRYPALNDIFWTLCYEIQFYLVFCLLVGFAQKLARVRSSDCRLLHYGRHLCRCSMDVLESCRTHELAAHPSRPGRYTTASGSRSRVLMFMVRSGQRRLIAACSKGRYPRSLLVCSVRITLVPFALLASTSW